MIMIVLVSNTIGVMFFSMKEEKKKRREERKNLPDENINSMTKRDHPKPQQSKRSFRVKVSFVDFFCPFRQFSFRFNAGSGIQKQTKTQVAYYYSFYDVLLCSACNRIAKGLFIWEDVFPVSEKTFRQVYKRDLAFLRK